MGFRTATIAVSILSLRRRLPALAVECGGDFDAWKKGFEAEAGAAGHRPQGPAGARRRHDRPERAASATAPRACSPRPSSNSPTRMVNGLPAEAGRGQSQEICRRVRARRGANTACRRRWSPPSGRWRPISAPCRAISSTLDALATLSHDCRRPELFRPQLMALLKLIDLGIVPPDVKGAWAGEIGQTQILPRDYLEKGVDGDGDGEVDLRGSAPDVIMTTANFVQTARLEGRRAMAGRGARPRRHAVGADRPHQPPADGAMERLGRHRPRRRAAQGSGRAGRRRAADGPQGAGLHGLPQLRRLSRMEPVLRLHADRRPSRRPARRLAGLRSAQSRSGACRSTR